MKAGYTVRDRSADLEIVLKAIVRTAAQVCEAQDAQILLVEGDRAAVVARHGRLPSRPKLGETYPLSADLVGNRAIIRRRTIHVRNLAKTAGFRESKAFQLPVLRQNLVRPAQE
jgi:hypothetical protein